MKIILAQPRGFCAGVVRAIETVNRAICIYGTPLYVKHEIVHNEHVVNNFKLRGVVFIDDISSAPSGSVIIFSAHGVSKSIEEEALKRNLNIIDATCPLVSKVHMEMNRYEKHDKQVILIGHHGHPEIEGTIGRSKNPDDILLVSSQEDARNVSIRSPNDVAYVTQTTLSVDDTSKIIDTLKTRFPNIIGPNLQDICYATQNRQSAVKKLAKLVDIIFVIGSKNSSNSNRLRDLGEEYGVESHLISGKKDIEKIEIPHQYIVGITSGASAPEILVNEVISFLKEKYNASVEKMDGEMENIKFKLPKEVASL